ncbi:hypothetical protein BH24DEI2_BH24DEI2_21120 [soil metagenome]
MELSADKTAFSPAKVELPFATDPSVLRGDWSGTIQNVPAEQDVALELVNLVATCPDAEENKCFSYTFTGKVRVGDGDFVPTSGWGYSGNYLYVLTSPPRPLGFEATFQVGGDTWLLSADYLPYLYGTPPSPEAPMYEGYLSIENNRRGGMFTLEPRP